MAPDPPDTPEEAPRILIPMVVAFAFLMEQLDATIITTAVPDMARSLATTPVRMNLAVTTYVLTLAVFIPLSGWLADRFGARRIFVLALALFTVGSLLCGIADSFAMLVATRALQGMGGAMMTPVGRLILIRSFPRSELVTAMTYMSLPALTGPLVGPLLGGLLTTYLSWRWIFYVNLPLGLAGIVLALRFIPDGDRDPTLKFDFPGFVMVGSGLALAQVGLESIGRSALPVPAILGLLAAAAMLLIGAVRRARRVASPVVDFGLFRLRNFFIGTLGGGICRIGMNGTPFLLPLMLQLGFGMSPVVSGSLVLFGSAGALVVRSFIAPLLRRLGFGSALVGTALLGSVILAGFALLEPDTPHWVIGGYVFLFGVNRSVHFMTSNMLSYADVPEARLSRATSLFGAFQQLTISIGVSLGATLLGIAGQGRTTLTPHDFHAVFLLTAIMPLLAVPNFLRLSPADGAQVSGYGRDG
jgi:EmrB/QacA subfamily drug resistance transporter